MEHRDLFSGFIRIHILIHASEEPINGAFMIEELAEHGYKISPGTIYPLLARLEERGYLTSRHEQDGKVGRKMYEITKFGRSALKEARGYLKELLGELK